MRRLAPAASLTLVFVAAACGGPGAVAPQPCPSGSAPLATVSIPSASSSTTVPPAPQATSSYDKPPQAILDALHTPSPPRPSLSPTREDLILVTWTDYPSIARVAEPYLKLAGIRVEPRNHSNHSTSGGYGIAPCATSYVLVHVADGAEKKVALPDGACADRLSWSADGKRFTFRETTRDAVELWVGETATGTVHRIDGVRLNPMLGSAVQWMPDQKTLLVKRVPLDQGAPPPAPPVPPGPNIQESNGQGGQSSTYEARDVLKTAHDEALFDYYAASELVFVDVATAAITPFKKAGLYGDVDAAPGGNHVLVETIHRPYSHVVTVDRFPRKVEVFDRAGASVYTVADLPLADRVPVHGVPTGPRDYSWRPTDPGTLVWAEALDGGDWNKTVPNRDKVMMARAPFSTPPTEVVKTEQRYAGFTWGERPGFALLGDHDENKHWAKTWIIDVDNPSKKSLLWDMSTDEHYKDPGDPVTKVLPNGSWVIRQDGDAIFLSGDGASPDGDRPFLDRYDVAKKTTERLFRSDKTSLEYFYAFDASGTKTLLTWHQSPTDPPNVHVRAIGPQIAHPAPGEPDYTSTVKALTHLPDPIPAVRAIKKKLVRYKRKDGVDLKFTIYTPPGYQDGTKIPTILYAYPLDYADASKAGQVTGSQQTFTRLRDHMLLLLAGYAIIEDASFPVVGDPKKAYDTYLDQLVMDAKAAVDQAVAIGVADPARIGVTGHSHGALMTANLLAHSNMFRAGIATSGSYNKTLTAFGFQNERRSVWQAPDVYLKVSPFFAADKIKAPILIIHGEDDANPGTTPLQAEKLYEAVRGNGGVARLVMLPYEPHWYSSMESNEQLLYEEVRWFDTYVKNATAVPPTGAAKP